MILVGIQGFQEWMPARYTPLRIRAGFKSNPNLRTLRGMSRYFFLDSPLLQPPHIHGHAAIRSRAVAKPAVTLFPQQAAPFPIANTQ